MKHIARIIAVIMLIMELSPIYLNTVQAMEASKIEITNGYVEYTINKNNGRFSIKTEKGATYLEDDKQPLLFEEYKPDTSFTTFKINGEDYIYGNDYGFMGIGSEFLQDPINSGYINQSIWEMGDINITQEIALDDTDENAGNVKITYLVKNNGTESVDLGSRILLDTMLGANDGAPLVLPGDTSYIETEKRLSGDEVPVFWKALNHKDFANVVSYGLLSGWRDPKATEVKGEDYNTKPNAMVIGHWDGLSRSKWDYDVDASLNFTDDSNKYGSKDSAVALYWDAKSLEAGEERVYETYYGIGQHNTKENSVPVDFKVYSTDRLFVKDDKSGYTMDTVEISGLIDNRFLNSEKLINAKVRIDFNSTGMSLPYGKSQEESLGDIDVNQVKDFTWELTPSLMYSWNNYRYRITLSADNLEQAEIRDGSILMPPVNDTPPDIQIFGLQPNTLYFEDIEKRISITGESLQHIEYSGAYSAVISAKDGSKDYVIDNKYITFTPTAVDIDIPVALGFKSVGEYSLTFKYIDEGEEASYTTDVFLSDNLKYMVRKYGILVVVRSKEKDAWQYDIQTFKDEDGLNELKDTIKKDASGNKAIVLDIRADRIIQVSDIYTIDSPTATINSAVTCITSDNGVDDHMTIQKKPRNLLHEDDYIMATGFGQMKLVEFLFQIGPYEIVFEDGKKYTFDNEDENIVIDLPNLYNGVPYYGLDLVLDALPIKLNRAILREKGVSFGGSIDLLSILTTGNMAAKSAKKEETGVTKSYTDSFGQTMAQDHDDIPDNVDPGMRLNIDDLRFGMDDYGTVWFEGVKADGYVGVPRAAAAAIIPGVDLGVGLEVSIDTFNDWDVDVTAAVDVMLLSGEGNIGINILPIYGISIPIIDTLGLKIDTKPGCPLVPPTVVAFISGGNFKVSGIYDTVTHNFDVLPPLALQGGISFSIVDVLKAEQATVKVSLQEFSFKADAIAINAGAKDIDIFKNAGFAIKFIEDKKNKDISGFEIEVGTEIDVESILYGHISGTFGVDENSESIFYPVIFGLSGSVGIKTPSWAPIVPNKTLAGFEAAVNQESVMAKGSVKIPLTIIEVPFGVKYVYGDSLPTIVLDANGRYYSAADEMTPFAQVILDENGEPEGVVHYGTNMAVTYDSTQQNQMVVASLDDSYRFMASTGTQGLQEDTFEINGFSTCLIVAEYFGQQPEFHLYDPTGAEVILVDGENYYIEEVDDPSGEEGDRFTIGFNNPMKGTWRLTSSRRTEVQVLNINDMPEFTNVTGSVNGSVLTVDWTGEQIDDKSGLFILSEEADDASGRMIAVGVDTNLGSADFDIPTDLSTGDYYIHAQLLDANGDPLDTFVSATTFSYMNPDEPKPLRGLNVENMGSGFLGISWVEDALADGYFINVYDAGTNGESLAGSYELSENQGENIIGGSHIENIVASNGMVGDVEKGLIPGNAYEVRVCAFNEVGELRLFTKELSQTVTLRVPNPPTIDYSVSVSEGNVFDKGMVDEVHKYLSNTDVITLDLLSDQDVRYDILINGVLIHEGITDSSMTIKLTESTTGIGIVATNNQRDITQDGFSVDLDMEAPVLRIDSPQQGDTVTDPVTVKGSVELNSMVLINGIEVGYGSEGIFEQEIAIGNDLVADILVEAYDEAGNKSEYFAQVFNGHMADIKELRIKPNTSQILKADKVDYDVVLVTETGEEFAVPDHLIKWSSLDGGGVLEVTEDGYVTGLMLGNEVLIASYKVNDTYAFEDAVIIEVVDSIKSTEEIEAQYDLLALHRNDETIINVYENFSDGSNRLLDSDLLVFDIASGSDYISISSEGLITALNNGTAIVTAGYSKNGVIYEDSILINVVGSANDEDKKKKLSDEDELIIDILLGLHDYDAVPMGIGFYGIMTEGDTMTLSITTDKFTDFWDEFGTDGEQHEKARIDLLDYPAINRFVLDMPVETLKGIGNKAMQIDTPLGRVLIPCDILDGMASLEGNVQLHVALSGDGGVREGLKGRLKSSPVDISIRQGEEDLHWSSNTAKISIAMPYDASDDSASLVILYIDDNGFGFKMTSAPIDHRNHVLVFDASHLSKYVVGVDDVNFGDLANHQWAVEAIETLALNGVIKGTSDKTYSPAENISRADFMTLVVRYFGLKGGTIDNFKDVPEGLYYSESIAIAKNLGIAKGDGSNRFKPTEAISREDMMTILFRTMTLQGTNDYEKSDRMLENYLDYSNISKYALESVEYLVSTGLINGYDNQIKPKDHSTRAEVAQLLYNLLDKE